MTEDFEMPAPPRFGGWITLYCLSLIAAITAIKVYELRGLAIVAVLIVPFGSLGMCVWNGIRARRIMGGRNPAIRRYFWRFATFMVGYGALLSLALVVYTRWHPTGVAAFALAILPALPLVGVIWAIGRLLTEQTDEYLRYHQARQMLVATGFLLVVATVWGFLEQFEQVPHVPAYWGFIVWCAGLGVGSMVNERRP